MKSITLVGYMCVGKTTVGRAIARKLGISFYDLDWYIEERFHTSIPDIFRERGEAAFRDMERRMLHEAAEFEDIVLSAGGGTPCFFDNMDYLNSVSETVYLRASVDTILRHLAISKGKRPLLEGKSPEELRTFVTEQLAAREPFYMKAKHIEEVSPLETKDKVDILSDNIISVLNRKRQ